MQIKREMTLDRSFFTPRPRVTSVHSWYLTSFVILSFLIYPFALSHISLTIHIYRFFRTRKTVVCYARWTKGRMLCSLPAAERLELTLYDAYRRRVSTVTLAGRFLPVRTGEWRVWSYFAIGLYLLVFTYSIADSFPNCNRQIVKTSQGKIV